MTLTAKLEVSGSNTAGAYIKIININICNRVKDVIFKYVLKSPKAQTRQP